jgi:1,2-diacylglycerol 3-beta-galactosyltransferase
MKLVAGWGAAPLPVPLLFLIADTGGGHRAAARAVSQALDSAYPGIFAPVLCDPLRGDGSSRLLRWVTGLYEPLIRLAPWLWGAVYYGSDSLPATRLLRLILFSHANRRVVDADARHRPALIVSFHPLLAAAAVKASQHGARAARVVTIVTDLITTHISWRYDKVDLIIVPSAPVRSRCLRDGLATDRCVELGLPVTSDFSAGPLPPHERARLRRSLGVSEQRFLLVLSGGGAGAGGIARRAAAILRHLDDVEVVAICGRNRRLERRLARLAADAHGRLTVKGFIDNMADWLHCADLVVTKAGPGTIAEATCCGAPLLLTFHAPGQEKGNVEYVVRTGAGRHARGVRQLLRHIDQLRQNPAAVDAMRAASARLGRPDAATDIAAVLARLAGVTTPDGVTAAATVAVAGNGRGTVQEVTR